MAFGLYNAAALAAAALLYFAIERPGLLLRDRLTAIATRKEPPQPALANR
jgi:peptidoglycan/LPS O-acetylase OafA/YrhL